MKKELRFNPKPKYLRQFSFDIATASQLQWEDEEEFSWQGEMYDVVSKKIEDGRLLISCIPDKDEDWLLVEYRKTTEHNQSGSKSFLTKFTIDNFVQACSFTSLLHCMAIKRVYPNHVTALLFQHPGILSPPPKVC